MNQESITSFINRLASDEPTPGGGAAVGIGASMGVAAIMMAARFSDTDRLEDEQRESLKTALERLAFSKDKFLELVEADEEGFQPLAKAYRMPRSTEEEKQKRQEAIEQGLAIASQAPARLMEEIRVVLNIVDDIFPLIKRVIISDIGVGTQLLLAAAQASRLNLSINTRSMKDTENKAKYTILRDELGASIVIDAQTIQQRVEETLG